MAYAVTESATPFPQALLRLVLGVLSHLSLMRQPLRGAAAPECEQRLGIATHLVGRLQMQ